MKFRNWQLIDSLHGLKFALIMNEEVESKKYSVVWEEQKVYRYGKLSY